MSLKKKRKRHNKEDYSRGDKVFYYSTQGGKNKGGYALFVSYDYDGFPDRDCILAIRIGTKKNHMVHKFRWPLRLISPSS